MLRPAVCAVSNATNPHPEALRELHLGHCRTQEKRHVGQRLRIHQEHAATFLLSPPDTDFQRGYLAALLNVAEEALDCISESTPFAEAQICSATGKMHWLQRRNHAARREWKT